jgi:hypothetical protein
VLRTAAGLIVMIALASACRHGGASDVVARDNVTTVEQDVDFHGWKALVLRNQVEAVVVPAIGRVVALRIPGGGTPADPFWRHPGLATTLAPDENGWINFGGDKAWPAPQSEWERIAGRSWPPPATFDARPYTATVVAGTVHMESEVDERYGMRVRRDIRLTGDEMTVDTTYHKLSGPPVRVAVWTITQLTSPERIFLLLPERSTFPGGRREVSTAPPADVVVDGRLLSLARDRQHKTMIASDADALLWVGKDRVLLVRKLGPPPSPGAEWPGGAHAQVYTSPDGDLPYVELELLGQLDELSQGEELSLRVGYRLMPRSEADPLAEARKVMARHVGRVD